jgi:predicted DNA-binding transcriptional regulator YafY
MAKKPSKSSSSSLITVTPERAARLYRLLKLVGAKPQTREVLKRRLSLDLRGFYRDLELLRAAGINLSLIEGHYMLQGSLHTVIARLPFPDPRLTLSEAVQLAKGRSAAHRKLKKQLMQILGKNGY